MDAQSTAILEILGEAAATSPENAQLKEGFDRAMAMLSREDQGWQTLFSGGEDGEADQYGLTLDQLKQWSPKIRESAIGAPWIGAGHRRRRDYVWKDGIRYGNIPAPAQGKKNVQNIIDRPMNQMNFFGKTARFARELCLYSDGVAFWIGEQSTFDLTAIPLRQITDEILEPNGLGYAIAYKREWSERDLRTGKMTEHVRWYFVEEFKHLRVPTIKTGGADEEVDQKHTIFDMHVNRAPGLVYGAPDALAAYVWNGIAREATLDGKAMMKALATFALKASVKTTTGGQGAAMKLAEPQGAGQTAVLNSANDLVPLASAGKGYDFKSISPLIAIIAASLDVSLIDLSSSPGDAGASYGAGQLMNLPTRLAMMARREEHIYLDQRVLRWMGVTDPDVNFVPFDTGDETYRAIQSLVLLLNSGTHTRQEVRDMVDDLLGQSNGTVPTEANMPTVQAAKALAKVQPAPAAATPAAPADQGGATLPQTASPDQGKSNGTGGQSGTGNDIRRGQKK